MNADDQMSETFNANLDAAYQKALPVINERIAAYQRDVASGELRDVFSALDGSGPMTEGRDPSREEINDFGTVDCEQVVVCADDDSTARVRNEPNLSSESKTEEDASGIDNQGHDHDCQCPSCESRRDERLRTAQPIPSQPSNAAQSKVDPCLPFPPPVGGVAEQQRENGLPAPDAKE